MLKSLHRYRYLQYYFYEKDCKYKNITIEFDLNMNINNKFLYLTCLNCMLVCLKITVLTYRINLSYSVEKQQIKILHVFYLYVYARIPSLATDFMQKICIWF